MPARVFGGENCTIKSNFEGQGKQRSITLGWTLNTEDREDNDWIHLAPDRDQQRSVVNGVMNVKIPVIYCLAEEMLSSQRGTPPLTHDMAVLHKWKGKN